MNREHGVEANMAELERRTALEGVERQSKILRLDALRERDAHRQALNRIAELLNVVHEDDKIAERVRALKNERDQLSERVPRFPFDVRCADALADEVDFLVRTKFIDSRSPAADALIDYRNPPTSPRSDRLVDGASAERTAGYTMSAIAKWIEDKAVAASVNDTERSTSVAGEIYRELAAEIRAGAWRR